MIEPYEYEAFYSPLELLNQKPSPDRKVLTQATFTFPPKESAHTRVSAYFSFFFSTMTFAYVLSPGACPSIVCPFVPWSCFTSFVLSSSMSLSFSSSSLTSLTEIWKTMLYEILMIKKNQSRLILCNNASSAKAIYWLIQHLYC